MSTRKELLRTRKNLVDFGWHPGKKDNYRGFGTEEHGFCLIGALRHNAESIVEIYDDRSGAREFLDKAIGEYTNGVYFDAMVWNDCQRSVDPVLAFLDYAILRAPN